MLRLSLSFFLFFLVVNVTFPINKESGIQMAVESTAHQSDERVEYARVINSVSPRIRNEAPVINNYGPGFARLAAQLSTTLNIACDGGLCTY